MKPAARTAKKRATGRPQAVLFDMDGVIVDSMPYHFIAWYEALRPLNITLNCFDVYYREGERWQRSLKDFLKGRGIRPTRRLMRSVFMRRQRLFRKYFKRSVFTGAEELVRCLKGQGYLLGLVTGTPADELRQILPAGTKRLFDCVVTGDMVKNGKPDPEPYRKAARLLSVRPSRCVVIENSPYGIASAKRAGMFCIGLTTSLPARYLSRADIVAERLGDISGIVDGTCAVPRRRGRRP